VISSPPDPAVAIKKISNSDFRGDEMRPLPEGGIALYVLDLRAMATAESRWLGLLSADERDRAARFHFERDRRYYCAARGILRILLGGYVKTPPPELNFAYSEKGKPALASPCVGSRLAFNVSHSGDLALLGFTPLRHIGVDIEKIREDFDSAAIARRFFSSQEQIQLSSLPSHQQHQAFFRCWTRKEAFIKAIGEGLSHPLSQFDVTLNDSGTVSLTTRPEAAQAERWWLQSVDAGAGYAAAFAVSRE
jgi:4'-phosphopantetheinyl transferase